MKIQFYYFIMQFAFDWLDAPLAPSASTVKCLEPVPLAVLPTRARSRFCCINANRLR